MQALTLLFGRLVGEVAFDVAPESVVHNQLAGVGLVIAQSVISPSFAWHAHSAITPISAFNTWAAPGFSFHAHIARSPAAVSQLNVDVVAWILGAEIQPGITFLEAMRLILASSSQPCPQVSDIVAGIKPSLTVINDGVKKSSLLVPHSADLP